MTQILSQETSEGVRSHFRGRRVLEVARPERCRDVPSLWLAGWQKGPSSLIGQSPELGQKLRPLLPFWPEHSLLDIVSR
jgi:hypothetical protein